MFFKNALAAAVFATLALGPVCRDGIAQTVSITVSPKELLGKDVYGDDKKTRLCLVAGVIISNGHADSYILTCGGWQGLGSKDICIAAVNVRIVVDDPIRLLISLDQHQIEAIPECKQDRY
jgi:hypothetical protein